MEKDTLISLIDLMLGLTPNERKILEKSDKRKVEFKYKLALTEKTDEMMN